MPFLIRFYLGGWVLHAIVRALPHVPKRFELVDLFPQGLIGVLFA